jgi:phosphohistidine phosphatase SixA
VVYLVRHADKAPGQGDPDVQLSDAGRARAMALAEAFSSHRLDAIYATHLRRTQQTVAPLAERLDLDLHVLPASATDRLVARLTTRHCGAAVLVAGHSNTLPEIMKGLGVASAPAIADAEYGVVYAVERGDSGPTLETGTFDAPP